jgi:hypothetical protein
MEKEKKVETEIEEKKAETKVEEVHIKTSVGEKVGEKSTETVEEIPTLKEEQLIEKAEEPKDEEDKPKEKETLTEEPERKETLKEELKLEEKKEVPKEKPKEEVPRGGKMYVKLSDNFNHRSWTDIIPSWVIYRKRTKLTPMRWSSQMKKAVRDGILEVVEKNPTSPVSSFDPIGPKGVEVREIKTVTSDKDTKVEKDKVIELNKKPEETKINLGPSKKLDEVLKKKEPVEIGVKIKEAPLPKKYTEVR